MYLVEEHVCHICFVNVLSDPSVIEKKCNKVLLILRSIDSFCITRSIACKKLGTYHFGHTNACSMYKSFWDGGSTLLGWD